MTSTVAGLVRTGATSPICVAIPRTALLTTPREAIGSTTQPMENKSHDATGSAAPGATNRQRRKKWEKWAEGGAINSPHPSMSANTSPVHMCDGQYPSIPPPDYGKLTPNNDPHACRHGRRRQARRNPRGQDCGFLPSIPLQMRPLAPRMRDTGREGGSAGGQAGYAVRDKTASHAMMTSIRCICIAGCQGRHCI